MAIITALKNGRGRGKRINLFLDGRFALSLGAELAVKEKLAVSQELSARQIEALASSEHFGRCFDAAARYLGYRPRSEHELRQRLRQRGFSGDSVEAVLTKLKEKRLVDDIAFAEFWKDNRQSFSPRSQWLTKRELQQKGVAGEIIDQVVSNIDDADNAYRAAATRARSLKVADYQGFRHRLGGYLKRRGFGYGIIIKTIERLWQEKVEVS